MDINGFLFLFTSLSRLLSKLFFLSKPIQLFSLINFILIPF